MPRDRSHNSDDPFAGLLLPMGAWKAIDDAHITHLDQPKAITLWLDRIEGMTPEIVQTIRDRLDRLAARRAVRVRLTFPKRSCRSSPKTGDA